LAAVFSAASYSRPRTLQAPSLPRYFALLAIGYTLVAIYGSLVPFEFAWPAHFFTSAGQTLTSLPARATASLFDVAANVALFVPLGFLWSGATLFSGSQKQRAARSVAIVLSAALLSAAIECLQVGLPARTVSPFDVAAETLGAALGCGAWWVVGQRLSIWLAGWQAHDATTRRWNWLLQFYLAAVSFWWLLPLNLSWRPGELLAKFRTNVNLKPLSDLTVERGLSAAATLALLLPVGVLLATAGRRRGAARTERESRWLIAGLAALLAAGQFLVVGRESDILQIAALGMGLVGGVWLAAAARDSSSMAKGDFWRSFHQRWQPITSEALLRDSDRQHLLNHRLFAVTVILVILGLIWSTHAATPGALWFTGRQVPRWTPTWPILSYWIGGLAALFFAPRWPVLAPAVFVLLNYGIFHRGHVAAVYFLAIGGREACAVLGMIGACLNHFHERRSLGRLRWVCVLGTGYAMWGMFSAACLVLEARPWKAEVWVQTLRLVDCAIVLWMAAMVSPSRNGLWLFCVTLAVGVAIPGIAFPEGMFMNHVTASLVAIALPLSLYAIAQTRSMALQISLALVIFKLGGMLLAGQSRSAVAGAVAGVTALALLSRRRWWFIVAAMPLTYIGLRSIRGTFLDDRFRALLEQQPGWDTGRLELWEYAMRAFRAFPIIGMGPGTGPGPDSDVHNSYLAALSETGAVGLALYLLIWLLTVLVLLRAIWLGDDNWRSRAIKAMLAAILAHLAIGCGYALQGLPLAFLLAGLGLSLSAIAPSQGARPREVV